MKGGIRRTPMNKPLNNPQTVPVPTAASTAIATGQSALRVHASTVAHNILAVPADKSMPPVMIISVIPNAATATGAVNTKMTRAFRISIKRPCPHTWSAIANPNVTRTSASIGPSRSIHNRQPGRSPAFLSITSMDGKLTLTLSPVRCRCQRL